MELQALLVLCGIGVAGVAVVLLMGLFSNSGTSYEEAIAQQRRATTELLALAESKNKPKKKEKKASKKQAKREKRETAAAPSSEAESEALAESGIEDDPSPPASTAAKPHVEFSASEVIQIPNEQPAPQIKIRKRGKDKIKPILINKEDPSCLDTSLPTPGTDITNHFEEVHPKDEMELFLHDKQADKKEEIIDKKEQKPVKGAKNAKAKPAPVEPAKDESRDRHNSGDAPKEQRKAKKGEKKSISEDSIDAPREEIVLPLTVPQPTELTTEKLLKQVNSAGINNATPSPTAGKGKKKKPEPNVLSLMAGDAGGVNVGELVRVVKEAPLSRTEIQILTDALLNKHHDPLPQHSEWTEGPNDPMQKMKKQLADKEKALAEEMEASQALHAKLKELRATLNAERTRATTTARAAEQASAAARAELHTQQARLQRLMEDNRQLQQDKLMSEANLIQQLNVLQGELNARVLEVGQARCETGAVRDNMIIAQQHASELAQQLQEANRACSELDQQRGCAVHAEQVAQAELRQTQERLTELQAENARLQARLQAAEAFRDTHNQQMSTELSSLKEQIVARDAEIAEIKQMRVPAQNGLPANADHSKAAELAKVESVVESLRGELAKAQSCSNEQRAQLATLQSELLKYQTKNNEAVAKSQETQYSEAAAILRSVCPAAAPGCPESRDWLQTFADNLKKELDKRDQEKKLLEKQMAEKPAPTPDTRVKELGAQNEHLQALVDKYKRIIDDTEGVLSRLQLNVTTEEQRWAQQLADKQRELDELRQRTVAQMQKKIESLEVELEKSKAGNHNHTFADAERLTEERLMMANLSNKQNTDVSNGPLQMGLEDK